MSKNRDPNDSVFCRIQNEYPVAWIITFLIVFVFVFSLLTKEVDAPIASKSTLPEILVCPVEMYSEHEWGLDMDHWTKIGVTFWASKEGVVMEQDFKSIGSVPTSDVLEYAPLCEKKQSEDDEGHSKYRDEGYEVHDPSGKFMFCGACLEEQDDKIRESIAALVRSQ